MKHCMIFSFCYQIFCMLLCTLGLGMWPSSKHIHRRFWLYVLVCLLWMCCCLLLLFCLCCIGSVSTISVQIMFFSLEKIIVKCCGILLFLFLNQSRCYINPDWQWNQNIINKELHSLADLVYSWYSSWTGFLFVKAAASMNLLILAWFMFSAIITSYVRQILLWINICFPPTPIPRSSYVLHNLN